MVIGIAGPTASGKTTVARVLEEEYGALRKRYSAILAEIARERGLDENDKAILQKLYLEGRKEKGEDFLAEEMKTRLKDAPEKIIVIEGNRRLVDVPALREIAAARGDELKLLYFDASQETRCARYQKRLEELGEEPVAFEDFCTLEENEAERELVQLKEIFEKEGIVINTDTHDTDQTMEKVKEFLKL